MECPEYLTALLAYIRDEMDRLYWNKFQENWSDIKSSYMDPFGNYGNVKGFDNGTFEVHAYNWNDDYWDDLLDHPEHEVPNFKCGDVEITWYKYFGRGMRVNRDITPDKAVELFEKCMASLQSGWNNKLEDEQ